MRGSAFAPKISAFRRKKQTLPSGSV